MPAWWTRLQLAWRALSLYDAAKKAAYKENPAMPPKNLLTSKTFWINLLTSLVALIGYIEGYVPPDKMIYIVVISNVVNMALRLITNQPVSLLPKPTLPVPPPTP